MTSCSSQRPRHRPGQGYVVGWHRAPLQPLGHWWWPSSSDLLFFSPGTAHGSQRSTSWTPALSWPTRRSKGPAYSGPGLRLAPRHLRKPVSGLALGKRAGWLGLCVPGKGSGHLRPVPVSSLSANFALLWLPGPRLRIHSEALTDISHVGMTVSDPPCQRRKADEVEQSQGCEEGFWLDL